MHLALRPYVTTGVAIVGASVIAVAPIAPLPADIQIPNPAVQLDSAVELSAVVEDAVNDLIFAAAEAGVSVTDLAVPLLTQLLGLPPTAEPVVRVLLNRTTLGLFGPLISGGGAIGTASQDVLDSLGSGELATIINAIIGAQGTVADGFVNGRFGPDLDDLLTGLAPFPILAGGIINPGNLSTLPGSVPTAQTLVTLLFGLLAPADMAINSTAASERLVEDAVNDLIFAAAEAGVSVTDLAVPLLTQLLGLPPTAEPVVRVLLARTTLGLFGPLISGGGATGTGIQDVLDSLGSGDLATIINAIIGAQGTVANGLVNGRFGPNLGPLVGAPAALTILAGGIINPGNLLTTLPGSVPTAQTLVTLLFGLLALPDMASVTGVPRMSR